MVVDWTRARTVRGLTVAGDTGAAICRNFDRDAPLQGTLDFNHQVFAEDKAIVEKQFPEDLPINLQEEVHIRADKSSITYRQGLARLGLGRSFTA